MYFKKAFPTNDCEVVQGVRTDSKKLSLRKEHVSPAHWRLQAQILHCAGGQLILWLNIYFPRYPRLQNCYTAIILVVFTEIEKLLNSCGLHDCCLGIDLNCDIKRDNGFTRAVPK